MIARPSGNIERDNNEFFPIPAAACVIVFRTFANKQLGCDFSALSFLFCGHYQIVPNALCWRRAANLRQVSCSSMDARGMMSHREPLVNSSLGATIKYVYSDYWDYAGDPRLSSYPFFSGGPWKMFAVIAAYLYFVKVLGPQIMKNREPFDLRGIILKYNIFMAAANAWFFYKVCEFANFGLDTWKCPNYVRGSTEPREVQIVWLGWLFVMSRLVEFLDTIFFVLRKKYNQVSTLHVFHHAIVPSMIWFVLKCSPTVGYGFVPWINSAVHTLMYSYYALSTIPSIVPYLWWKRYLTRIQIFQFVLVIINCLRVFFMPGCQLSPFIMFLGVFFTSIVFALFCSFYIKSYIKTSHQSKTIHYDQSNNNLAKDSITANKNL